MADKFVNRAFITTTESAPGTLTFTQLTTGISTFSKQAFLIHQIQWFYSQWHEQVANGDYAQAALVSSNKMSGINLDDPSVAVLKEFHNALYGAAANIVQYHIPYVDDFSSLPGGGLIIPANPIFLAVEGVSLGAAQTVTIRILFTVVDLKADEYIELVEATRMVE